AIANYNARVNNAHAAETWFRKSVATFEEQRSSLKDDEMKLPFFANADSLYKDYAQFLIGSGRSRNALQLLDRGRAQTLEEGVGATVHDSQLVHQRAIDAHRTRLFRLPGQSDIDSHVKRYEAAILRSNDPLRQKNEDARYLFDVLIAPAAASLHNGARVVLISDGALDGLNFE